MSHAIRRAVLATAVLGGVVAPAAAQPAVGSSGGGAAVAPQALALAPSRDSLAILAGGRMVGAQVLTLERRPDGFRYTDVSAFGTAMQQETEVALGPDGSMRRMHQVTRARGQVATSDLTYADGRVRGTIMVPGPAGTQTLVVDTAVTAAVVDDNAFQAFLPALPWSEHAAFTISVFVGGKNALQPWTVAVVGRETITVPAGTFDTFRVTVAGGPAPLTLNVQTAAPHRVVRAAPTGAPFEIALAR